jgi:hypothetical protein
MQNSSDSAGRHSAETSPLAESSTPHPSAAPGSPSNPPLFTMRSLGTNGRFGNQLFQYAFLKIYARRHGLQVQTPAWIGQPLFGCNDPPLSRELPTICEWCTEPEASLFINSRRVFRDVDIWGWFQYHTSFYAPDQEYFRSLFAPMPAIAQPLDRAVSRLRTRGATIIGLHIRRGDFGYGYFYRTPTQWYLAWLERHWRTFEKPMLYIATDEPQTILPHFAAFNPLTAADLGPIDLPQAPFFPDFYMLSRCDIAVISNSTFSVAACLLNRSGTAFHRPSLAGHGFVPFDPWNTPVLLPETLDSPQWGDKDRPFIDFMQTITRLLDEKRYLEALRRYDRDRGMFQVGPKGKKLDYMVARVRLKLYDQ